MRRSILCQPLAVLMIILLLPPAALVSGGRRDFQAGAQTIVSCNGSGIIKNLCGADGLMSSQEIRAFETDTVNAWLAAHELPLDNTVTQYGRSNLRNELRAYLLASIVAIIRKPADQRSAREQAVYAWIQAHLKRNEIQLHQAAIDEWNLFNSDRCGYRLDADIVREYKISYDPTPFCYRSSSLSSAFSFHPVPAPSYFLAVGLKKVYGAALAANSQRGAGIGLSTAANIQNTTALALLAGPGAGLIAGVSVAATAASIFPHSVGLGVAVSSAITGAAAAGAGAIIAAAVVIGIQAGMQAVNNQAQIDQLNALGSTLQTLQSTSPDLSAYLLDDTGRVKLTYTFILQTLPDTPSTAPLPPVETRKDSEFGVTSESGIDLVPVSSFTFLDWSRNKITTTTWGGYFIQAAVSSNGTSMGSSISPTIYYLDWSGNQMIASRSGSKFLVQRSGSTLPACPANLVKGVSTQALEQCSAWVAEVIPMHDKDGQRVSLRLAGAPKFTSPLLFTSPVGIPGMARIAVNSGSLLNEFKLEGTLPVSDTVGTYCQPGAVFLPIITAHDCMRLSRPSPNELQLNFFSTTPRSDKLTFSATNMDGTTRQTVVVTSYNDLAFLSAPPGIIKVRNGIPVRYTVTTTGGPSARLSGIKFEDYGLTLTDNGDGTATIAGTTKNLPVVGCMSMLDTKGAPGPECPKVTATNGVKTLEALIDMQGIFSIDIGDSVGLTPVQGTVGQPTTIEFTPVGVGTLTYTGKLPAGMTLIPPSDATSNIKLTGTPLPGSEGEYQVTFTIVQPDGSPSVFSKSFRIEALPAFLNLPVATFYLNQPNTFELKVSGYPRPQLSQDGGALPPGVNFTQTGNTVSLTGTPQGQNSYYPVTFKATNRSGFAEQLFILHLRPLPGDLNGDYVINCQDYQVVKTSFGRAAGQSDFIDRAPADLNGDGIVTIEDLSRIGLLLSGNPVCH